MARVHHTKPSTCIVVGLYKLPFPKPLDNQLKIYGMSYLAPIAPTEPESVPAPMICIQQSVQ